MTLAAVAVSAAVGSGTTLLWTSHEKQSTATTSAPTSQSAPPAPQFSPEQISSAKDHLCQTFDIAVRGQEGQGGLRNQGNLNVPLALRSVNGVVALQNAVVPAVPAEIADAARAYISAELDATTAVMGNVDAAGVNRLVDTSNAALGKLLDVCGLPR